MAALPSALFCFVWGGGKRLLIIKRVEFNCENAIAIRLDHARSSLHLDIDLMLSVCFPAYIGKFSTAVDHLTEHAEVYAADGAEKKK